MRNIHFQSEPAASAEADQADQETQLGRLRKKTNDPATEYAQRPGEVQRISDAVAACILCKSGASVVERHQIKVQLDGETYLFASTDSMVIPAKNGTGEKVCWVLNRLKPDALHLLSSSGEYIETLPLKGEAAWWSNDEESKRAFADSRRSINRDLKRMQELHRPDTRAAAADAAHNAAQISRVVSTFPVPQPRDPNPLMGKSEFTDASSPMPSEAGPASPARISNKNAERLHGALQSTETARSARYVEAPVSEDEYLQT